MCGRSCGCRTLGGAIGVAALAYQHENRCPRPSYLQIAYSLTEVDVKIWWPFLASGAERSHGPISSHYARADLLITWRECLVMDYQSGARTGCCRDGKICH